MHPVVWADGMISSYCREIGCLSHIVACGLIQLPVMPFPDQAVARAALCIERTGHRGVIFDMLVDYALKITGISG